MQCGDVRIDLTTGGDVDWGTGTGTPPTPGTDPSPGPAPTGGQ